MKYNLIFNFLKLALKLKTQIDYFFDITHSHKQFKGVYKMYTVYFKNKNIIS